MQIDFIVEESFSKLLQSYIQDSQPPTLLNSMLIHLHSLQDPCKLLLHQCLQQIQIAHDDRQTVSTVLKLLQTIFNRSPSILNKAQPPQVSALLSLCKQYLLMTICGNESIALLQQLSQAHPPLISPHLNSILTDTRLHIPSYRHSTRKQLYTLLFQSQPLTPSLILASMGNEKDPRNMVVVLRTYLALLNSFPHYKSQIYQHLQAYYPIDVVQDQSIEKINCKEISTLLDQCLCHHLFQHQTLSMLLERVAVPPIEQYLPTLTLYLQSYRLTPPTTRSLLLRLTSPQHLLHTPSASLPPIHCTLFQSLFHPTPTIQSLNTAHQYLTSLIHPPQINKCLGTVLSIVKEMNQLRNPIAQLYIQKYILQCRPPPSPQLALFLVALDLAPVDCTQDSARQIVNYVLDMYPTAEEAIRIIILRILIALKEVKGVQQFQKELTALQLVGKYGKCIAEYLAKTNPHLLLHTPMQQEVKIFAAVALWINQFQNQQYVSWIKLHIQQAILTQKYKTQILESFSKMDLIHLVKIIPIIAPLNTIQPQIQQLLRNKCIHLQQQQLQIPSAYLNTHRKETALQPLLCMYGMPQETTNNPFLNLNCPLSQIQQYMECPPPLRSPTAVQRIWHAVKGQSHPALLSKIIHLLPEALFLKDKQAVRLLMEDARHAATVLRIAARLAPEAVLELKLPAYCQNHLTKDCAALPLQTLVPLLGTALVLLQSSIEVKLERGILKNMLSHRKRQVRQLVRCILARV